MIFWQHFPIPCVTTFHFIKICLKYKFHKKIIHKKYFCTLFTFFTFNVGNVLEIIIFNQKNKLETVPGKGLSSKQKIKDSINFANKEMKSKRKFLEKC